MPLPVAPAYPVMRAVTRCHYSSLSPLLAQLLSTLQGLWLRERLLEMVRSRSAQDKNSAALAVVEGPSRAASSHCCPRITGFSRARRRSRRRSREALRASASSRASKQGSVRAGQGSSLSSGSAERPRHSGAWRAAPSSGGHVVCARLPRGPFARGGPEYRPQSTLPPRLDLPPPPRRSFLLPVPLNSPSPRHDCTLHALAQPQGFPLLPRPRRTPAHTPYQHPPLPLPPPFPPSSSSVPQWQCSRGAHRKQ